MALLHCATCNPADTTYFQHLVKDRQENAFTAYAPYVAALANCLRHYHVHPARQKHRFRERHLESKKVGLIGMGAEADSI